MKIPLCPAMDMQLISTPLIELDFFRVAKPKFQIETYFHFGIICNLVYIRIIEGKKT